MPSTKMWQWLKLILIKQFFISLFLFSCSALLHAQLIPLDSLKKMKVFESLETAEQNPLAVYRLDLSKSKLKSFPDAVFQFPNLNELVLDKNKIDSLPAELSQLENLQILKLSSNLLEEIPPCIMKLKNLVQLDMSNNFIDRIPASINKLTNLESLILWDNPIEDYPDELESMQSLKVLDLLHNQISYDTQDRLKEMLSGAKIIMSAPCACSDGDGQ